MKYEYRKFLALALVILTVTACLTGCGVSAAPADPTEPVTKPVDQGPTVDSPMTPTVLGTAELKQIRVAGYDQEWVNKFRNTLGEYVMVNDYDALVAAFEAIDDMDRNVNFPEGYDQEFFAENRLVLIPWASSTGSVRYVADAFLNDGTIRILLDAKTGDVSTADMADWLLVVVLPREDFKNELPVEVQVPQLAGPGVGFHDGLDNKNN